MKARIHYEDLEKKKSIQGFNRGFLVIKLEQMIDKESGLTKKDRQKPEILETVGIGNSKTEKVKTVESDKSEFNMVEKARQESNEIELTANARIDVPKMEGAKKMDMQEDIVINEFEKDLAKKVCSIKSYAKELIEEIDSLK